MRIAFYAPMKPPISPVPSGDRQMARQLIAAIEAAGHEVELVSRFSSRDGGGDGARQNRIAALGGRLAERLARRLAARPPGGRPDLWFTYHLYHKAPDWLGPAVADSLDIPYVVCEASFAPKQKDGPWAHGHEAAREAIRRADRVIGVNTNDRACVEKLMPAPDRYVDLNPFTDTTPLAAAGDQRDAYHAGLVTAHDLDPQAPLLLAVAMMRSGDKLASYRQLAAALAQLQDEPWQLLVVGDGPARDEVRAALDTLGPDRVRYAGEQPPEALPGFYAACDMLVWPAVREAYGVALLEAQAAGLPVVAGRVGGVGDIVRDNQTGLLVPPDDPGAFAEAIRLLLQAPYYLAEFSTAARTVTAQEHSIAMAAAVLDKTFREACGEAVA